MEGFPVDLHRLLQYLEGVYRELACFRFSAACDVCLPHAWQKNSPACDMTLRAERIDELAIWNIRGAVSMPERAEEVREGPGMPIY